MNISDSECSSGCESGWTVYLDHSFSSERRGKSGGFCETRRKEKQVTEEEEEEEEDLSMVSDASSGPPHLHDQEEEEEEGNKPCYASKRQRMKEKPFACGDQDDTASSPLSGFSDMQEEFAMPDSRGPAEGVVDYSQGFSATHFQRRRSFGFLHSPFSGKQMSDLKGFRR